MSYQGDYDRIDECPRCGGTLYISSCYHCLGAGEFDHYEEDPLWYDPGEVETCPECGGSGELGYCETCGPDPTPKVEATKQ